MIIMGAVLAIIGVIGIFIGIHKNNTKFKNTAIVLVILSIVMMIVPLVLLRNV